MQLIIGTSGKSLFSAKMSRSLATVGKRVILWTQDEEEVKRTMEEVGIEVEEGEAEEDGFRPLKSRHPHLTIYNGVSAAAFEAEVRLGDPYDAAVIDRDGSHFDLASSLSGRVGDVYFSAPLEGDTITLEGTAFDRGAVGTVWRTDAGPEPMPSHVHQYAVKLCRPFLKFSYNVETGMFVASPVSLLPDDFGRLYASLNQWGFTAGPLLSDPDAITFAYDRRSGTVEVTGCRDEGRREVVRCLLLKHDRCGRR